MARILRILLVEENEADCALLQQELRLGGYEPEIERVAAAEIFEAALARGGWDLVLCGFSVVGFHAMDALERVRRRGPDLPFIILATQLGEEAAVAAMKAGAQDCLIKGHYARLLAAIERELKETVIRREHVKSEQALKQSERLNRAIIEYSPVGISLHEPGGKVLYQNQAWQEIWSALYPGQLWPQRNEATPPALFPHLTTHTAAIQKLFSVGVELNIPEMEVAAAGGSRWISHQFYSLRNQQGRVEMVVAMMSDLTAARRDAARLHEQAALLDQVHDAIVVLDSSCRVVFWNQRAEALYGWKAEEILDQDATRLLWPPGSPTLAEALEKVREKGEWMGEMLQNTKYGKERELYTQSRWTILRDEHGQPKRYLLVNTDVSAQKELEKQFLRSQRMESLGTLAGGVAHDLNNVLAPILMSVQYLQDLAHDESSQAMLSTLKDSAQRGANIVKQLLTFARGIEGERILLQPKYLIKEMARIAEETFPKTIRVGLDYPVDLWAVNGDSTQLHQVLLNLCINARDAMPEGGLLQLSVENVDLDETYAQMNTASKAGPYVVITVADTGRGMSARVQERLFEPFFTTKGIKGTGLGLSTALGIIKSHNGFIHVYSEEGRGSQFKVYLPAVQAAFEPEQPKVTAVAPQGRDETILVVEDEQSVLNVTRKILQTNGYRVIAAMDGTEALAIYVQSAQPIDAVLTDMMMPFMDGVATIRALRKINPQLRIIGTSGMMTHKQEAESKDLYINGFISKPYTAAQLLVLLRQVLDGAAPGETL